MPWLPYVSYFFGGAFMLTAGLGGLLMSLMLARTFGRFHGGNAAQAG
jgi:hypothetical protein